MSEAFVGSVEIITHDGESRGVPGVQWTPEVVPAVVGTLAGVAGLVEAEPEAQPSGRTPEAQWTGQDGAGFPVTVLLWRQREEDLHPPLVDQSPPEGEGGE